MTIQVHLPSTENEEKVTLQKFTLEVQLPVEKQSAHSLLMDIMGEKKYPLLISPEGGMPKKSYPKLISELHTDEKDGSGSYSGEGENKRKYTEEDTIRFWMLRNPEFHNELVQQGWTLFPEMKEWSDYEKKNHLLPRDKDKHVFRKTTITNLIKVLKLGERPESIQYLIDKLEMVKPFMKDDHISMGYRVFISPPVDPIILGETTFPGIFLRLEEFWNQWRDTPKTITNIDTAINFGESYYTPPPRGWTEDTTERVIRLIRDQNGKEDRGYYQTSNDRTLILSYNDRAEQLSDPVALEGKLNEMQKLAKYGEKASALEREEIEKQNQSIYKDRKVKLSAPVKAE